MKPLPSVLEILRCEGAVVRKKMLGIEGWRESVACGALLSRSDV